ESVDAQKYVACAEHFGPSQGEAEENRVARRDVSGRNPFRHLGWCAVLRHIDIGRQRRAAEAAEVKLDHDMLLRLQRLRNARRALQLVSMALSVTEADRVGSIPLALRDRQHRGRIEPSTQ